MKQNPAGKITLFAFDAGQGLSEHSAPFDAVVQVIDGEGIFIIGGEEHNLKEGALIIMPLNSSNIIHIALSAQNIPSGIEIRSLCGKIFPVNESQLGENLEGEKCSSCYYYDLKRDKKVA